MATTLSSPTATMQTARTTSTSGPFSLSQVQRAINRARTAGLSVLDRPRTFELDMLLQAIQQAAQTGGEIPVPEERFQSPEGIASLIQQTQQALQPLTEARTAQAEADFNRQMQLLRNRLAAQGALAGGGATAQQLAATQDLLRQLDAIRAEQQAQAIPLAFQAAELGLAEAAQRFAMQESNRQFLAQRAQQLVENLLSGMSAEEAMRQFEAGFRRDLEQNAVQNLLAALGLQEQMRQFDVTQALSERQFQEAIRQFNETLREQQRQFNIGAATELSSLFGMPVMPAETGLGLFGQLQGRIPIQAQQIRAAITGFDPVTGQPTLERTLGLGELALQRSRLALERAAMSQGSQLGLRDVLNNVDTLLDIVRLAPEAADSIADLIDRIIPGLGNAIREAGPIFSQQAQAVEAASGEFLRALRSSRGREDSAEMTRAEQRVRAYLQAIGIINPVEVASIIQAARDRAAVRYDSERRSGR